MFNIVDQSYQTLILTDYGRHRILESITGTRHPDLQVYGQVAPVGFNLTHLCLSDTSNTDANTATDKLGHVIASIPLTDDVISQDGDTLIIIVDIDSKYNIREIGLFETYNGSEHLFAYISGINIRKAPDNLSFKLTLNLNIRLSFADFDYPEYEVVLAPENYSHSGDMTNLYDSLTRVQLDMERCVQKNARLLSFNRPNVYYAKQLQIAECFNTLLLMDRYGKIVDRFAGENITDYFTFPDLLRDNYTLKNLADEDSTLSVTGKVLDASKDNINFRRPTSIVYSGTISSMSECGTIIAKSNPRYDSCYFELTISADDVTDEDSERYIRFSAYSYDINMEQQLTVDNAAECEPKLIGEYRIVYRITKDTEVYRNFLNKECTFTITFNGSEDDPKFNIYLNDTLINSDEKKEADLVYETNYRYHRPPDFVDYNDEIRYDIISDVDGSEVIRVTVGPPDFESNIYEDTYYETLTEEEVRKLRFLGVFDDLLRDNEIISNYNNNTGMMTEDPIQSAQVFPDIDFIRSHKIIGDVKWKNYQIRYDFYNSFTKECTLRNYTEFVKTETITDGDISHKNLTPQYYTLNSATPTSIITFSKVLTPEEIVFITNMNRS